MSKWQIVQTECDLSKLWICVNFSLREKLQNYEHLIKDANVSLR